MLTQPTTQWRARAEYLPSNASKAGLLEETRAFLAAYADTGDAQAAQLDLINRTLPQRSRSTRVTITRLIMARLARWQPPAWVLDDLVAFAEDARPETLQAALLLHVSRQDALLYDFVQDVVAPRWQEGIRDVTRADVQRFLDAAEAQHPEITRWSHETREKLAGNVLSILRDYGLLAGTAKKRIVEPLVPDSVVGHLVRLLREEGVAEAEIPYHPDWNLWLWDPGRAQAAIARLAAEEGQP